MSNSLKALGIHEYKGSAIVLDVKNGYFHERSKDGTHFLGIAGKEHLIKLYKAGLDITLPKEWQKEVDSEKRKPAIEPSRFRRPNSSFSNHSR